MTAFQSTEELNETMLDLWNAIANDPGMSAQLLKSKMTARFHYEEPACSITVDCGDGQKLKVHAGSNPIKPMVELFMKADVAHEFWLGKVNMPTAIMSGKIVSKGPVNKALGLLPVIKPAYELYPGIYQRRTSRASV